MSANLKKSLVAGSVTAMVIGVLILVILTLHSCGGSGDTGNSPVYDENGNCLNCSGNGDASVISPDSYENGDTPPTYADGKPIPQPDTEPYVCPVNEPPKMCTVLPSGKDPNGYIPECTNGGGENCGLPGVNKSDCICHGGYFIEQSCTSDADCQKVPPDKYPPCVCWEFCGFLGEWQCEWVDCPYGGGGTTGGDSCHHTETYEGLTADGTICEIGKGYYGIPGKEYVQDTITGEPSYTMKLGVAEDGTPILFQYSPDGTLSWKCYKIASKE